MTPPRTPRPPITKARHPRGFALLITITLVAFLVLILVGLASFTRVETQVASNTRQTAAARQQALQALTIALGELQRAAGPDQRATASASLHGPANPLPAPSDGTRHWTGVWGPAANPRAPAGTEASAALLTWLVSRNEETSFATSTDAADFGRVTTSGNPAITPASGIAALDPATLTATIDGQPARILVGPATANNPDDASDRSGYVVAPLQEVRVPASSVPGLAGETLTTVGRYAWWIGDEGVKARVNLNDAHLDTPAATRHWRHLAAQRHTAELMRPDGATPLDTLFPGNTPGVLKVLDLAQLSMLAENAASSAALEHTRRGLFHEVTAWSRGVLADTLRGGLRLDLTAAFAGSAAEWSATDLAGQPIYPAPAAASGLVAGLDGPSWDLLRAYYRLNPSGASALPVTPPDENTPGLSPVILGFRLGLAGGVLADGRLRYYLVPAAVLWNPYDVAISPATYGLSLRTGTGPSTGVGGSLGTRDNTIFLQARPDGSGTWQPDSFPAPGTLDPDRGVLLNALRFTLDSAGFQPGQAIIYTLAASTPLPASAETAIPLAPGLHAAGLNALIAERAADVVTPPPAEDDVPDLRLVFGMPDGASGRWGNFRLELSRDNPAPSGIVYLQRVKGLRGGTGASGRIEPIPDQGSTLASAPDRGWRWDLATTAHAGSWHTRWLAQYNPRAPYSNRSPSDSQLSNNSGGFNTNPAYVITNAIPNLVGIFDYDTEGDLLTVPVGYDTLSLGARAPLFHIPSRGGDLAHRFLSLGHLRMAPLYRVEPLTTLQSDAQYQNTAPAFALGASLADGRISPDRVARGYSAAMTLLTRPSYDHSYLLNHALWDRVFLSTVSRASPPTFPLPNGLLEPLGTPAEDVLRDHRLAASALLVNGAFNINSASVEAWTAVLGALRQVPVGSASPDGTPFPDRDTPSGPRLAGSGFNAASPGVHDGFRNLDDDQIRALATALVDEIRSRGPFLSLAQFVNRSLLLDDVRGVKGALQAAIDATTINAPLLNPAAARLPATAAAKFTSTGTGNTHFSNSATPPYYTSLGGGVQARLQGLDDGNAATGAHSAPGFLSQGDVLAAIGPALASRSDTFRIRVYGETVDPLDSTQVTGRAWAEAIVQRLPDYVSASDTPDLDPAATTPETRAFGRKFEVVTFRWLTPADI